MANKNNLIHLMKLVCTDILLANRDELDLILLKFAHPLYFFFLIRLFGTSINKYCQKKIVNDFAFYFATFSCKTLPV